MDNNKNLAEITLIDGKFTGQEAKEILLHLIFSKMNFHTKKSLGSIERNGEPDPVSERRIEQLLNSEKEIKALMEGLAKDNKKLVIESSINIRLA
ncbi:MAG: hypothetical protein WBN16_10795 [Lutimonas sp.]